MTAPTEKASLSDPDTALDDLRGIGFLLCNLSAIGDESGSVIHPRSLYFLGDQVDKLVATIRSHLEKQP